MSLLRLVIETATRELPSKKCLAEIRYQGMIGRAKVIFPNAVKLHEHMESYCYHRCQNILFELTTITSLGKLSNRIDKQKREQFFRDFNRFLSKNEKFLPRQEKNA